MYVHTRAFCAQKRRNARERQANELLAKGWTLARERAITASSRVRETNSCHGDHQRRRSDTKGWGFPFYRRLCHAEAATAEPKNTLPSRHAVHSSLNFGPFEFRRSGKYLRDWNERAREKRKATSWRLCGAYNAIYRMLGIAQVPSNRKD